MNAGILPTRVSFFSDVGVWSHLDLTRTSPVNEMQVRLSILDVSSLSYGFTYNRYGTVCPALGLNSRLQNLE